MNYQNGNLAVSTLYSGIVSIPLSGLSFYGNISAINTVNVVESRFGSIALSLDVTTGTQPISRYLVVASPTAANAWTINTYQPMSVNAILIKDVTGDGFGIATATTGTSLDIYKFADFYTQTSTLSTNLPTPINITLPQAISFNNYNEARLISFKSAPSSPDKNIIVLEEKTSSGSKLLIKTFDTTTSAYVDVITPITGASLNDVVKFKDNLYISYNNGSESKNIKINLSGTSSVPDASDVSQAINNYYGTIYKNGNHYVDLLKIPEFNSATTTNPVLISKDNQPLFDGSSYLLKARVIENGITTEKWAIVNQNGATSEDQINKIVTLDSSLNSVQSGNFSGNSFIYDSISKKVYELNTNSSTFKNIVDSLQPSEKLNLTNINSVKTSTNVLSLTDADISSIQSGLGVTPITPVKTTVEKIGNDSTVTNGELYLAKNTTNSGFELSLMRSNDGVDQKELSINTMIPETGSSIPFQIVKNELLNNKVDDIIFAENYGNNINSSNASGNEILLLGSKNSDQFNLNSNKINIAIGGDGSDNFQVDFEAVNSILNHSLLIGGKFNESGNIIDNEMDMLQVNLNSSINEVDLSALKLNGIDVININFNGQSTFNNSVQTVKLGSDISNNGSELISLNGSSSANNTVNLDATQTNANLKIDIFDNNGGNYNILLSSNNTSDLISVPNANNNPLTNINVQGFNTSQDKLSISTLFNDSSNAYTYTVVADPLASNQIKVDLVKLSLNGSASPITSQITESKISSVVLSADTSLTSSKSSLDNILVENDLGVPVNSTIYGNQANASTPEIFAGSVLKDTIVYGGSGTDIFTYITPGDIFLGGSGTNDSLVLKGLRSSYTLEYIKDLPDTDYYSNFKDATNIKDTFFPLLSTRYNNLEDTAFSDDMAKLMRIRQDNWDTNEYALVSVDKFYFNGIEYLSDFIIAKEFSWTDTGTDYSFNEVLGYANQEGSLLKTINVEASKLFQGNYSIFQNDIKINVLGNSSSSGTNPNDFFNNPGSYTRFQLNDFVEKFSINTGGAPQAELSDLPKGVDVVIDGNSNNNIIKVSGYGKAIINGVGGNDTLVYSGKSSVKIDGGEGDDFIVSSDGNDFLLGGIGNDVIFANGGNDAIVGGGGNDLISGGDGDDDIQGLEGNDQIFGGLGNDTISGGKGNDQIFGNSGHDTLNGDSGNDYINGGTGGDIIDGGSGNDTLEGGAGFDRLEGNSGDDVIFGGDQSGGVDKVLSLNTSTLTPLIESSAPASTVTEPPTNPLIPNFKDIMLGGSGDDVFILGKGTSTLTSTVYGGSGNDTVVNSNQSGTSMVALDFLIKPATVPTNYANLSNGGLFVA